MSFVNKENAQKSAGAAASFIGKGAKAGYSAIKNHKSGSSNKDSEHEEHYSSVRPLESLTDPRTFQPPPKRSVGSYSGSIPPSFSAHSLAATSSAIPPPQATVQNPAQYQLQIQPSMSAPQQQPGNQVYAAGNYQDPSQASQTYPGPPQLPGRQPSQNQIGGNPQVPAQSQAESYISDSVTRTGQSAGSQYVQSQLQNSGYAEAQNPQIQKAGAAFGSFIGGQLAQQGQQQAKQQLQQQLQNFQNPQSTIQTPQSQDVSQQQSQFPQVQQPEQTPQAPSISQIQGPDQFQQPGIAQQATQQPNQFQQLGIAQQPNQFQQPAPAQQPIQQSAQFQQHLPAQQPNQFQPPGPAQQSSSQPNQFQQPGIAQQPNQFQQPAPAQQPGIAQQPKQFQQPAPAQQPIQQATQFQLPSPAQQPSQFPEASPQQQVPQLQQGSQVPVSPQLQQASPVHQFSQNKQVHSQDVREIQYQQRPQPQPPSNHQSQDVLNTQYQPTNQPSQMYPTASIQPPPTSAVPREPEPLPQQSASVIASPPQSFAPPPVHVARGSSPSNHAQTELSPTISTAAPVQGVHSGSTAPPPPPRNTFSLPDISTVGPPPPKPFRSAQEKEKLEQERRHQEEFNKMRNAHRTASSTSTPSYVPKPNSPLKTEDTGEPAPLPPEKNASKDTTAFSPPPSTFRSSSSTKNHSVPVAAPKPTVKTDIDDIASPSPPPPAPRKKFSSKESESLVLESHKKPPPKPSKPKSLANINSKQGELENNKQFANSEPIPDSKTSRAVPAEQDLVSEMERVMLNRRKKLQDQETATPDVSNKPSRPAKPVKFEKISSPTQRQHHNIFETPNQSTKNTSGIHDAAPVKPTRPPKPTFSKPPKPLPAVSKPKPYVRTKVPIPDSNQQLNLQLETGWYKRLDQIPPDAAGLIYRTSMGQIGGDYTRYISFRMKDLGTVQAEIKWSDSTAPIVTQKYTAPPTATQEQLFEGRNLFNEHVATWAESHEGKCVGDGECWTLAKLALEKGCGKHAFVSEYYHHGALLFTKDASGVIKSNPTDSIARGDILQFYECTTKNNYSTTKLGAPHHTAIVVSCNSDGSLEIIHQNVNGVKKVMKQNLVLNVVEGTMKVYRPVTKTWIEEL
ncbi:Hypothetical protein PAS_chr2-1_0260 [Komagataella phaffii GS115]|uniref:BBC1/AIM3 cysteine proteinase-fold domain-containing protein n=1 Tax=Komagataella phaffii (strain GS115 / ATCC 20864) TaxID=644223 RepID=C4R048_KOMPG|nr:Hypothetical protein PAS_chr2-1_0260 [Komagataella phaffii GS115]CAY68872.1 Hypothetical protein PAS_chr2-1_0260 [Komagataella phaffii GS115]